ncbi:hypothetical protein ACJMK2_032392 [Sinanodonta woodiana]|uniref:Amyloid beta A4 protein-binding family B member 2 n=1 Tax=Sinanodonta woodiana TaxID=1069815 RepID=A0ABD3X1K9_SINWO
MSKDMDAPFLSFANPNYHFEDTVNSNLEKTENPENSGDELDINILSLANQKKDISKLHNMDGENFNKKKLMSQNSIEDDENTRSYNSEGEGVASEEENDDVDLNLVDNQTPVHNMKEKNTDKLIDTNPLMTDLRNKPRGILAYISLLEASARERQNAKKKELNSPEDYLDTGSGSMTPAGDDEPVLLKDKIFENLGFEINSPDSNDSGIQSDARSDDGIAHTQGPGKEEMYTMVTKAYKDMKSIGDAENVNQEEEKTPVEAQSTNVGEKTEEEEGENKKTTDLPEVLPPGWERCEDEDGPYYWHIKSGTIQREPPSPAPPDMKATLRSISINSDSSNKSEASESSLSSPSSILSTEEHLNAFEDHALQYAVKSLQNLTINHQASQRSSYHEGSSGEKPQRFAVRSLGWVEIAEEDLLPERSSKAVNKCIVDLSLGRNDINDVVGRWGDGKDLYVDLDTDSLRLIDPQDFSILNSQPIHTIRVWGVGRDNGRDFAYVARDKMSGTHMCHVFRCDVPARHIANALRDICKKIMMERSIQQSSLNKLARPTDLPNLETTNTQPNGQKLSFQSVYSNASFPTPMEEPKKVLRCHYLGSELVNRPTGMEVINSAIERMCRRVPPEKWMFVSVLVAPSTVTITEYGKSDNKIEECRVRYLSFMGIAIDNVKMCAFIVHKAEDKFYAHVFHCEPSAGPLCKTIEAACKLRYQKCLDAHHETNNADKNAQHTKTLSETFKSSVGTVQTGMKIGVSKVQSGVKTGVQTVQTGVKASVQTVQSGMKAGLQSVTTVFSMIRRRGSNPDGNNQALKNNS